MIAALTSLRGLRAHPGLICLEWLGTLDRVKRLILNADDFGLTLGVNAAIVELHQAGRLTSTTLMARAQASDAAKAAAIATPTLGVGCHVVLVDGEPVLPAEEVPTLVDRRTGRFRATLGRFVRDLQLGRIAASEIAAEAAAQIGILRSAGLLLTHVDTHKHTHLFPRVLAPLLLAARQHSVAAIRNPFEPQWSLDATEGAPLLRRMQVRALNRMRAGFLKRVAASGMRTTNGAIGVLATGTLTSATLRSLLHAMPDGDWELVTHPGYNDAALASARTRLLASRAVEFEALLAMELDPGVQPIHFGQLA